jgi:predicted amidohydrolase YtcJ
MTGSHGPGEFVLANAVVHTMDRARPLADALAVRDGRILAVGSDDIERSGIAASVPTIDLGGAVVLPGVIDAHTHVEFIALSRHFWVDVRGLSEARDIVARLREREAELGPGEWLVGQGTFGQALPGKAELDSAFPDRPVVVRWTMHKFVVNQAALDASGIDERTVVPPGMRLQLDAAGRLNGVLEEAWDLLAVPSPPAEELSLALAETLRSLFSANGVTTVHEIACTEAGLAGLRALAHDGAVPRIGALMTARPGHQPLTEVTADAMRELASRTGDERYWVQGVKIFLDGGRDGAFRAEELSEPADRWGLLTRLHPTLVRELITAVEAGLQVCTHAIGDLAQEIALSAIERVHRLHPDLDHRLRIEHFFNESRGTAGLERLVAAGGIAVPNPGFVIAEPDDPSRRQPADAAKYALRTLRGLQGMVPGNSDTAGAQPFTTNPWFTMRCMLELKNKNGVPVNPDEVLTVDEALRSFTVDAAFATRQDDVKGMIAPGYLADLAIVDRDPYQLDPEEFDAVATVATVVGGRVISGGIAGLSGEGVVR